LHYAKTFYSSSAYLFFQVADPGGAEDPVPGYLYRDYGFLIWNDLRFDSLLECVKTLTLSIFSFIPISIVPLHQFLINFCSLIISLNSNSLVLFQSLCSCGSQAELQERFRCPPRPRHSEMGQGSLRSEFGPRQWFPEADRHY
jgi:hypothetical protein